LQLNFARRIAEVRPPSPFGLRHYRQHHPQLRIKNERSHVISAAHNRQLHARKLKLQRQFLHGEFDPPQHRRPAPIYSDHQSRRDPFRLSIPRYHRHWR
jgi:hypothetical protein